MTNAAPPSASAPSARAPAPGPAAALLVVDVQNDFCPGGALPVAEGDRVVPALNRCIERFAAAGLPVVASRDWHPPQSTHFRAGGGPWPPHCVRETPGAAFHPALRLPAGTVVFDKGTSARDDGYSAFEGREPSGSTLGDALRARGVGTLWIGGLTAEYCVRLSTLDALREGFAVVVLTDAVRGLEMARGDTERALAEMERAGARLVSSEAALAALAAADDPVAPRGDVADSGDVDGVGDFVTGAVTVRDAALFTDLYELTMAAVYHRRAMHGQATFSLFARKLPRDRGFLVAAGLQGALDYLASFRFSEPAVAYLASLGRFDADFLEHLRGVRFTGDVRAVPEGTVVFENEPVLEVTAPIGEAQLVETALLDIVHLETVLASKAARTVLAARGRAVVEFGLRRTHGVDAGMQAARCAFIAGAASSSNTLAGLCYGIPPTGTMAHSFVEAFPREIDAFRAFAELFPDGTTLLLDTYDTVTAAQKAVTVAREMAARGARLRAVRLDSGDLDALSRAVRAVLDAAGLVDVHIFASGGLDEDAVARLVDAGAPIDAFGVGTRMTTSADAPYLDMAYKLVRYDGRDVLKLSAGKTTWAGEKQVWRVAGSDGTFAHDVLALRDEPAPSGATPLLHEVMIGGRLTGPLPTLTAVRERCAQQIGRLPDEVRALHGGAAYEVRYGAALVANQRALEADTVSREVHDATSSRAAA